VAAVEDLESVELVDLSLLALMANLPFRFALMAGGQELVPMDRSRALVPLKGEAEGGEGREGGVELEVVGPALMGKNQLARMARPRGNLAVTEARPGLARMAVSQQSAQERM